MKKIKKKDDSKEKEDKEDKKRKENKKGNKKVKFVIDDNIIIEFDENQNAKKIKFYNTRGRPIFFKPIELKKYLSILKKKKQLKSIILNYSEENKMKEKIEEKIALDKLSELIDECDEKSESLESKLNNINSKN